MKLIALLPLLLVQALLATPESEGRQIAEKADANNRNFVDEYVKNTMYLINANQDTVVRKMVSKTLERPKSEDYSIIQFLDPPDVKGTGLLTFQNPRGDDDQWLYLPDLRRVKKISSKNKSGAFMGSEFSYEDISANTLDKFSYKKIGEEEMEGTPCFVIEKIPTYKNSGYTSVKMWISKDNHLLVRQEFKDRKKTLLKVQTFGKWKQYGKSWRVSSISMENVQTKKKSILIFGDRKLGSGMKESEFTQRSLQRIVN